MPIITASGELFDYDNINKDAINIEDITHALANTNRFMGHTSRPYSVAEHTWRGFLVSRSLGYNMEDAIHFLMHDFTEAYVGDCPTPLKKMMPEFSALEAKINEAIYEKFEMTLPTEEQHEKVKRIDALMLAIEMQELTKHDYKKFITNQEDFDKAKHFLDNFTVQPSQFYANGINFVFNHRKEFLTVSGVFPL